MNSVYKNCQVSFFYFVHFIYSQKEKFPEVKNYDFSRLLKLYYNILEEEKMIFFKKQKREGFTTYLAFIQSYRLFFRENIFDYLVSDSFEYSFEKNEYFVSIYKKIFEEVVNKNIEITKFQISISENNNKENILLSTFYPKKNSIQDSIIYIDNINIEKINTIKKIKEYQDIPNLKIISECDCFTVEIIQNKIYQPKIIKF